MNSYNPIAQLRAIPFGRMPRSIWVVVIGAGVNRLGAFLQIFLILYLKAAGLSTATAGAFLTVYGVGSIVGVIAGGRSADLIGARRSIAGSMIGTATGVGLISVVHQLGFLASVCFLAGLSAQLFRPSASALISSHAHPNDVVAVMGVYRLSINVASMVGPLLGGIAYEWSHKSIFLIDAASSLCFAAVVILYLPRDTPANSPTSQDRAAKTSARRGSSVLNDRRFMLVVAAQFLTSLVEIQYVVALPLQLHDRGMPALVYTAVLAVNGAIVICCELIIIGFTAAVSLRNKVAFGTGLIGIGLALFGYNAGWILLSAAVAVWTVGEMLSAPSINAYPGMVAPPGHAGRYFAALTGGQTAGYAVGPVLGAAAYARYGSVVWAFCAVGGAMAFLGMWVGLRATGSSATNVDAAEQPAGVEASNVAAADFA